MAYSTDEVVRVHWPNTLRTSRVLWEGLYGESPCARVELIAFRRARLPR